MSGITYYRRQSPYEGDTTKRAGLEGCDIDNNFWFLENKIIESVFVSEDKKSLTIKLRGGEELTAENAFGIIGSHFDFEFDQANGKLIVKYLEEEVAELSGFVSEEILEQYLEHEFQVSSDNTLTGNGMPNKPLGIHPMYRTGLYRACDRFIDTDNGEEFPSGDDLGVGDRFLTNEKFSSYGILYNYAGVKELMNRLEETNSPWRVPTKAEWDDMLNAIEPDPECKNHNDCRASAYFGCMAGAILRQNGMWTLDANYQIPQYTEPQTVLPNEDDEIGRDSDNYCMPIINTPYGERCIPSYDFDVLPSGYTNDSRHLEYFKGMRYGSDDKVIERAGFWTSTNHNERNAWIKRFENTTDKVYQDIADGTEYYSIRLVKDFEADNFNESEEILGQTYTTCLMPSIEKGQRIWTSMNIGIGVGKCKCYMPSQYNEPTMRYFIWEWDGTKWMRNEVRRGEAVYVDKFANYTYKRVTDPAELDNYEKWDDTYTALPTATASSPMYIAIGAKYEYQRIDESDVEGNAVQLQSVPESQEITPDYPQYIKVETAIGSCVYIYYEKKIDTAEFYKKVVSDEDERNGKIYLLKKVITASETTLELVPITGGANGGGQFILHGIIVDTTSSDGSFIVNETYGQLVNAISSGMVIVLNITIDDVEYNLQLNDIKNNTYGFNYFSYPLTITFTVINEDGDELYGQYEMRSFPQD